MEIGSSDLQFTFGAGFKIWKEQASCDICMDIRVFTDDLMLCFCSDQTAGFVSLVNPFQNGKILVYLSVSLV